MNLYKILSRFLTIYVELNILDEYTKLMSNMTVCNLNNMVNKLVQLYGDFTQLKLWGKG